MNNLVALIIVFAIWGIGCFWIGRLYEHTKNSSKPIIDKHILKEYLKDANFMQRLKEEDYHLGLKHGMESRQQPKRVSKQKAIDVMTDIIELHNDVVFHDWQPFFDKLKEVGWEVEDE